MVSEGSAAQHTSRPSGQRPGRTPRYPIQARASPVPAIWQAIHHHAPGPGWPPHSGQRDHVTDVGTRYPGSTTANQSHTGMTPLNPNAGCANKTQAARLRPHRGSSMSVAPLKIAAWPHPGHQHRPGHETEQEPRKHRRNSIPIRCPATHSVPRTHGCQDDSDQYPQRNREFPNTGACKWLPRISSAMTMANGAGTSAAMSKRGVE